MEWKELKLASAELPPGFRAADWRAPIDTEAEISRVPKTATVKGMFVQTMLREVELAGGQIEASGRRYVAFKDYPMTEVMRIMLETGRVLHPAETQREQIRRVARMGFGSFAATMIGKVIFGAIGRDVGRIVRLGERAFSHAMSPIEFKPLEIGENSAHVLAREFHIYPECFGIAVAESVIAACGRSGFVAQKVVSPSSVECWMRWD